MALQPQNEIGDLIMDEAYYAAESKARDALAQVGFDFSCEQSPAEERILHLVTLGILKEN